MKRPTISQGLMLLDMADGHVITSHCNRHGKVAARLSTGDVVRVDTLGRMRAAGWVYWDAPANSYRITEAGRAVLAR